MKLKLTTLVNDIDSLNFENCCLCGKRIDSYTNHIKAVLRFDTHRLCSECIVIIRKFE